jgi:hypothetical protein
MKLRFANTILRGITAIALAATAGLVTAAEPADDAPDADRDRAVEHVSYVGDLSELSTGTCIGDSCGSGAYVGDCASGTCGLGGAGGVGGRLGSLFGCSGGNMAGCQPRKYDQPDLFYNFYSNGNCNSANAQMYISPLPVPHFVGHTFFTYQPFYPHEYMYWHKDRFNNVYDNGRGLNRTRALYYAPPIRTAAKNFYWNKLRIPR